MNNIKRLPYVYLIRHISSGKFYAGSRSSKNCHPSDFWITYFTSSKYVNRIILDESADSFEILEIIPRPLDDALEYEVALLKSINAAKSPHWLNRSNGAGKFSNVGIIHTAETKEKMSISLRGKFPTTETKSKISLALRGRIGHKHTIYTKEKISNTKRGKSRLPFSDDHCKNLSAASLSRPKHQCLYCCNYYFPNILSRFHNDKCKMKRV